MGKREKMKHVFYILNNILRFVVVISGIILYKLSWKYVGVDNQKAQAIALLFFASILIVWGTVKGFLTALEMELITHTDEDKFQLMNVSSYEDYSNFVHHYLSDVGSDMDERNIALFIRVSYSKWIERQDVSKDAMICDFIMEQLLMFRVQITQKGDGVYV